jgi:hypothetical protein
MFHKDYNRKRSVEKSTGRGSQGAWREDELASSKVTLTLTLARNIDMFHGIFTMWMRAVVSTFRMYLPPLT